MGLVVHGNVDVSSALIREMMWRGHSVVWCSGRGRVVGAARSTRSSNGRARVQQHVASAEGRLDLAREFIASKVSNQATQLRRSSRFGVGGEVERMRHIAKNIGNAARVGQILGFEGEAAAIYFGAISGCIAKSADQRFLAEWKGRRGRHSPDPLNAALSYAYGLLLADCVRSLHACGLDPHAGFVHSSVRNKPALALDLMEQFRPVVADSAVLSAINNGQLTTNGLPLIGRWRSEAE